MGHEDSTRKGPSRMDLKNLEPAALWQRFFEICAVPRPSHHEEAISKWLADWASSRGFACQRDDEGNVLVRVPASPGCEGRSGVVLQAHMDMVPQAGPQSKHDFERDPIRPRLDPHDPDWVTATGTTLGADDGLGIAAAIAVAEDKSLVHGPLECLFTVNEEDGMSGARAFKAGVLTGRFLLNLDGEDVDDLIIGCAGMLRTRSEASFPAASPPAGYRFYRMELAGFQGGHSGLDAHRRGNAVSALLRLLNAGSQDGLVLAELEGGGAVNALPREAFAVFGLPADGAEPWLAAMQARAEGIRGELGAKDPGWTLACKPSDPPKSALCVDDSRRVLSTLASVPNGCLAMEPTMQGVTRTSSNLGVLSLSEEGGSMVLRTLALARSSVQLEMETVATEIEAYLMSLGARCSRPAASPAWRPDPTSLLLSLAVDEYRGLFGQPPRISSIHAGLECGVFRPLYPDMEMLSLGPTVLYPHSPDERASVAAAQKFWKLLVAILARLR